ncbi:hypothetical protein ACWEPZ_08385 [Streptomyces sp. NPDC004288]
MKNFVATPDRPWVRVIIDEAHVPLSELVETKKEAKIIVDTLAAKARSLGIILTIVNQAVNADKLGGSTAIRTNVIQGGSLVMLRTDSDQAHLASTGFDGIAPGSIPARWDVERPLIYDEKIAMKDPMSTFGLGCTLGPGGAAEMMRTFVLEAAAPYVDTNAVAYLADWPDWDLRHEIAATPRHGRRQDPADDDGRLPPSVLTRPTKPETAEDKVTAAIKEFSDPAGLETIYVRKDQIAALSGLKENTLKNTLARMKDAGSIHQQIDEHGNVVRGVYALGRGPADTPSTDGQDHARDWSDSTSDVPPRTAAAGAGHDTSTLRRRS